MKHKPMHRRTFLRGAIAGGASVSIGLPLLEVMLDDHGTALAQNEPLPRRLGIFFWGNGRGVEADKWHPATTGAGWEPSVELAPLMELRDQISVVTNMTARMPNSPRGHHDGSVAILSGYDFIPQDPGNAPYRSTFGRKSIDQLAADQIGATTAFRSLELGISTRIIRGEGTTLQYMSHNGPDNANPPEFDPQALYTRLFAGVGQDADAALAAALQEVRGSVLDGVLEELSGLQGRVSTADQARLEQHAEHIRSIERRLESDAGLAARCAEVQSPGTFDAVDGREPLAERTAAMADLLALAMSCDLSRVFTVQFTGSVGGTVFWQVGADRGHHDLSHDGASTQGLLEASTVFTMEQLAVLLRAFRDTPDGTGTLLDNSAILATSDHSDGAAHSVNDFPVLVAGGAGGALVQPGLHYAAADGEHTNQVLLTLLRSVGVTIDEIGEADAHRTDGVSALEV